VYGKFSDRWLERLPFELVNVAMRNRELARAIGDDATAARWNDVAQRHAATLADPRVVIAFLLL
jgi:hypothetical protein